jgi:hypothetical protein
MHPSSHKPNLTTEEEHKNVIIEEEEAMRAGD